MSTSVHLLTVVHFFICLEGWQASVKAREVIDHLASFQASKEDIL